MHESLRQVVHLIFGLGIAGFVLLFDRDLVLSILVLALFAGFILSDAISRGLYHPGRLADHRGPRAARRRPPGKGALFFALGALFCIVFFAKEVAFMGLLVLALLDSVTTLAGLRFGRTRIYNHKSLEGTLAGFAATAIVLALLVPPGGVALATAVAAAVAELASPVDDNLVVPVVACLVLALLL